MPKPIKEQEKVAADALVDFSTEVRRNDTDETKTPINAETKYATRSAAKEKAVKKNKTPVPIDKKIKSKSTLRRDKNKKVDLAPQGAGEEDIRALDAPPNTDIKKKARRQSCTLLKKLDGIDKDEETMDVDGEGNKDECKDEEMEFGNSGGGGLDTDVEDEVSYFIYHMHIYIIGSLTHFLISSFRLKARRKVSLRIVVRWALMASMVIMTTTAMMS